MKHQQAQKVVHFFACSASFLFAIGALVGVGIMWKIWDSTFMEVQTLPTQCTDQGAPFLIYTKIIMIFYGIAMAILFIIVGFLSLPFSDIFRKNIHRLDTKPDLIDRVTALDIPLYKPKTQVGGFLTIFMVAALVLLIGQNVADYVTSTDNYTIPGQYLLPRLKLNFTLQYDTSSVIGMTPDQACEHIISVTNPQVDDSQCDCRVCPGGTYNLGQWDYTPENMHCWQQPWADTNYYYVSWDVTFSPLMPQNAIASFNPFCNCFIDYFVPLLPNSAHLSWKVSSYVENPYSETKYSSYIEQITGVVEVEACDQTPSFSPKDAYGFELVAFPSLSICGAGPGNFSIEATPRAICDAGSTGATPKLGSNTLDLTKYQLAGYSATYLNYSLHLVRPNAPLCIINKEGLGGLISQIIGLFGGAIGAHAIVRELTISVIQKFSPKKKRLSSVKSPAELTGLLSNSDTSQSNSQ